MVLSRRRDTANAATAALPSAMVSLVSLELSFLSYGE
jgi:hypothetical protein